MSYYHSPYPTKMFTDEFLYGSYVTTLKECARLVFIIGVNATNRLISDVRLLVFPCLN